MHETPLDGEKKYFKMTKAYTLSDNMGNFRNPHRHGEWHASHTHH